MSGQITEQKILSALKSVQMPGRDADIVTENAVSGVVIKDGNVGFTIEISPEQAGSANALRASAEAAVQDIDGVLSVSVILTAHKPASQASAAGQAAGSASADEPLLKPAGM